MPVLSDRRHTEKHGKRKPTKSLKERRRDKREKKRVKPLV